MKIELEVGEEAVITFKDSDGSITVRFGDQAITVEAEIEDSDGRKDVIYSERYAENMGDFSREIEVPFPTPTDHELAEKETELIRMIVEDAISQGWMISVNNGGDENVLEDSKDVDAVMEVLHQSDQDILYVKKGILVDRFTIGWIYLIYGNSPWEVVADSTTPSTDQILKRYEAEGEAYARSIGKW